MHDETKALLGAVEMSGAEVSCETGDPATFLPGLAVRRASTGALSLSSGTLIGVSAGPSLADTAKTAVVRAGNRVPLQLTDEGVASSVKKGDITFTAVAKGVAGDLITVAGINEGSAGEETVEVDGTDIVINFESTVSTAAQILAAINASAAALALISAAIDEGDEDAAQTAFAEDNLASGADSYPYAVIGGAVEVGPSTGKAVSTGGTATGAIYVTGEMTGVNMDGTEVAVALVDMPGGL